MKAEKEIAQANADAKIERFRAELETRIAEAEALKDNPKLLKILQLKTLQSLAQSGAKVAIGLDGDSLRSATDVSAD